MSTQIIRPARTLQGSLAVPGDKSISHRYAMLAGLAEGTTRLTNFSTGADPHSSLACMEALGATVVKQDARTIEVTGVAGAFRQPAGPLDCGNSGSTMRMLAGLIAAHPHTFTMIGDHSLTLRPMERISKPLSEMGAKLDLVDGHAPITVHGSPLHAIDFTTPIPSAQVKTAVLFAGLQAEGTTSLSEAIRTRDHSEHALKAFGATLIRKGEKLSIQGCQKLKAVDATVPGDISSAAFFLCAALLFPDSNLVLDSLGMNPTRAALLDVITALGGRGQPQTITLLNLAENGGHVVSSASLYGGTYNLFHYTLPKLGIEVTFVDDPDDLEAWRAAIRPNTKAFFAETLGNPKGDVLDFEGVSGVAHDHQIPLVVDSTVTTPYLAQPLSHGADIVVHSATKFIGGHGTSIGGVIVDGGKLTTRGVAASRTLPSPILAITAWCSGVCRRHSSPPGSSSRPACSTSATPGRPLPL